MIPTKTQLVYIKNLQRWQNERRWNRDSNLGSWLTTFRLTKLQTLETPVTIRLVKSPYPQLQVIHLTMS